MAAPLGTAIFFDISQKAISFAPIIMIYGLCILKFFVPLHVQS